MTIDYRELLRKYISYVEGEEGSDFIDDIRTTDGRSMFTPEEWAELKKLSEDRASLKNWTFHQDGTLPPRDSRWVFVFGSNLAGLHEGGAARVAFEQFGAEMGNGVGLQLDSYAIPTKDGDLNTMPIPLIKGYVNDFIKLAEEANFEDKTFFVTRIGCGLAGYEDSEIAPLFRDAPANCSFAYEWRPYLT
jgi:hypothetical protein